MELTNYGEEAHEQNTNSKPPVFLKVLCILTFVYAGIVFITELIMLLAGQQTPKQMKVIVKTYSNMADDMRKMGSSFGGEVYDQVADQMVQINNNHLPYHVIAFVFVALGIIGAAMMLKRNKLGFHFYVIYSLVITALPYIFVTPDAIPVAGTIFNMFISGLFVFMYSRNLHWLK